MGGASRCRSFLGWTAPYLIHERALSTHTFGRTRRFGCAGPYTGRHAESTTGESLSHHLFALAVRSFTAFTPQVLSISGGAGSRTPISHHHLWIFGCESAP